MRKIIQIYFLFFFSFVFSQTELVFVYFKDKPNASIFLANPLSELSQKALDRRTNLGIAITAQDAPIEALTFRIYKIWDLQLMINQNGSMVLP